ncbi:hypothetical protein [Haematobacter massiliensis]|nr:hypothetical protein [Haematobacter massiliensis]OWJ82701.1 hypothetical protein CDV51_16980 [Haematobacter massiliensis]
MPLYRYWPRAAGLAGSKLTTSTALAALVARTGYAVRTLSISAGQHTTAAGSTEQPFTAVSSSGDVTISGIMPPGAQLIYTDDPQRQAIIYLPSGGSVTVSSRTPATTADEYGRIIHGATLNPTPMQSALTTPLHGYDQRALTKDTQVNVTFSESRLVTYPLSMAAGDTLNAAKSLLPIVTAQNSGMVEEYFSLTVLNGAAPAGELFAPPVARNTTPALIGVDIDAIHDSLPNYASAGTSPPADLDQYLARIEKFQGSLRGNYKAADGGTGGGYADMMPFGSGILNKNYGRQMAGVQAAILPLLWTDAGTEAQKKAAIRAIISFGRQVDGSVTGPNGGIWTFQFPMIYLYRHFTGGDLTPFVMGAKGVAPLMGGNILGQFFTETPANLARYRTPHNTSGMPHSSAIRTVTAVSGLNVTVNNVSPNTTNKYAFRGLILRNTAGTKSATIIAPGGTNTLNQPMTLTLKNANPFVVGDQVWMDDPRDVVAGDPNWSVRWRETSATYTAQDTLSMDSGGGYRNLATGSDFLLCTQALGITNPTWAPLVNYTIKTLPAVGQQFGTWPSAEFPWSHPFRSEVHDANDPSDTWGLRLFRAHWPALSKVPQIGA